MTTEAHPRVYLDRKADAHPNVFPARKLYVAFELAANGWKVALGDAPARKPSIVGMKPFNWSSFEKALDKARIRFELEDDAEVLVCMEAGRDGFSVHRWLKSEGIDSLVIDPASVEVNRQKRRAKTDRLDALKLLENLIRHDSGWGKVWRVCRVPPEEAEDERHLHRERWALVSERTRHNNRIKSLLATQGVRLKIGPSFLEDIQKLRDPRGEPLRPRLLTRLSREHSRLCLAKAQIREIEAEMRERLASDPGPETSASEQKVWLLGQLYGIGKVTAHVLVGELFGWREFSNRREVGSAAGLTPTPYDTGVSAREQGISKAGNHRVRSVLVEAAWSWLRFQPDSELSRWYREKFLEGGKRQVRKGIVALARRLLVALWHFVEHGVVPEGALMNSESPLAQAN